MKSEFNADAGAGAVPTAGLQFRHLLLPVDFSELNLAAAQYALQIARAGEPKVTLLHVKTRAAGTDSADDNAKDISERLHQLLRGLHVQDVVIEGDPGEAINEHARRQNVDLIIMPTRGLGAVRRFLLGSVTAKVLYDAACPVLTFVANETVPAQPEPEFRRIACAIDLRPDALRVMRWAGAIAATCKASLTIVHATPQLEPVIGIVHDDEWCNHLAKVLGAEIEKLKSEASVDAPVRLIGGEPARTVAETTSELGADLLVIGRPSPHGLLGRLRTHSYAIISQAPCPVLSV